MTGDRWVDFHNHVIPGVDDGAADADQARAAVAALAAEGVGVVVATPHLDASVALQPKVFDRRMAQLDAGWERLQAAVDPSQTPVRLERGAEIRLDIPAPDLSDPRFRLGGGRAVLVEFAYFRIPPRSPETLAALRSAGWLPVLAHPERYREVSTSLGVVGQWLNAGAFLQVNAGSLLGRYGREPQQVARTLLERGWVHCVASDYHARGEPGVAEMRSLLEERDGQAQARRLFEENPSRLLRSEPCVPVDALDLRKSWRDWLRGDFGR